MDRGAKPLRIGAAARPYPGQSENGDAWFCHEGGPFTTVALVDGAGHGVHASEVAATAIGVVERCLEHSMVENLRSCHEELHGTRGAVMAIARFEPERATVTFAGVGNIEFYLWDDGHESHPVIQRGLLGMTLPTVRPVTLQLGADWVVVMHSDGVKSRFSLNDPEVAANWRLGPEPLAKAILASYARNDDDATVVVIMPAAT